MGCAASKLPQGPLDHDGAHRPTAAPIQGPPKPASDPLDALQLPDSDELPPPSPPSPPSPPPTPLTEYFAPKPPRDYSGWDKTPPPLYSVSPYDPCRGSTEGERLAALRELHFLNRSSGPRFGAIIDLLKAAFQIPIANIYLLEDDEVIEVPEGLGDEHWAAYPRCESACKWVTEPVNHEMLVIEDMAADARFRNSCWVQDEPHVRFYASAPLVSTDRGLRYGTLCLIDLTPRSFPAGQYQLLVHLAEAVVRELEGSSMLRFRQLALEQARSGVQRLVRGLACFTEGILVFDTESEGWPIRYANKAAAEVSGIDQEKLAGASFWSLFNVVPTSPMAAALAAAAAGSEATVSGSLQSREDVQAAVHKGQACSAACRVGLLGGSYGTAGGAGGNGVATTLERGGDYGASGDLENVLKGRASLDSLLPRQSGELSSAIPSNSSPSWTSAGSMSGPSGSHASMASHADVTVSFAPATAPEFCAGQLPVGIPALAASWSSPKGTSNANGTAAGALVRIGSRDKRLGDPFKGAQPALYASSTGRWWFATLARRSTRQPGGGSSASGGGGSASAGNFPAAASVEYLRPRQLSDLQLGPLLGAGASGRTYRGQWYGGTVAVKIINVFDQEDEGESVVDDGGIDSSSTMSSRGPQAAAAPVLEALLSRALSHPHIVPTHAWGVSEAAVDAEGRSLHHIWIVQSLCCLGTLARAADEGRFEDPATGGPSIVPILRTAAEVAGALAYLHSMHVVHADLTGNNILLSPSEQDSRGFTAQVADFGLSRPTYSLLSAVPRPTFGTVTHMAPELLAADESPASPASDCFALGVVLWEMLSGRRAWRGMGPLQVVHNVAIKRSGLPVSDQWPPGVQDLVRSCLASEPEQRPTAEGILERIRAELAALGEELDEDGSTVDGQEGNTAAEEALRFLAGSP